MLSALPKDPSASMGNRHMYQKSKIIHLYAFLHKVKITKLHTRESPLLSQSQEMQNSYTSSASKMGKHSLLSLCQSLLHRVATCITKSDKFDHPFRQKTRIQPQKLIVGVYGKVYELAVLTVGDSGLNCIYIYSILETILFSGTCCLVHY